MEKSKYSIVSVTWPDKKVALLSVEVLVKEKLVACAQVIDKVSSVYVWKNQLTKDSECLSLLKTKHSLYKKLEKRIRKLHPYTLPEIIAYPIIEGSKDYLNWITENTKG